MGVYRVHLLEMPNSSGGASGIGRSLSDPILEQALSQRSKSLVAVKCKNGAMAPRRGGDRAAIAAATSAPMIIASI